MRKPEAECRVQYPADTFAGSKQVSYENQAAFDTQNVCVFNRDHSGYT